MKNVCCDYLSISPNILVSIHGGLPFDVFIKRGEGLFTKLFKEQDSVDKDRIIYYQETKGVESFFILKGDLPTYERYVDKAFAHLNSGIGDMNSEEALETIHNAVDVVGIELYVNHDIDMKALSHAAAVAKGCVDLINNKPKCITRVVKLLSGYPYQMRHALMTAIFSTMLAKMDEINSPKMLETIALGALLHDIGMSRMSFDFENIEDLSAEQWSELKTHPEIGKKILDSFPSVSLEVKLIVLQHHEQANGHGYPNKLYGSEIYRPAKIVAIAGSFCALISKRPFRQAFTKEQALHVMIEDQGKFDKQLLKKFAKFLGVTHVNYKAAS